MTHEEAWVEAEKNQKAFNDAGIPWNKNGSPHRLRIAALKYYRLLPPDFIIGKTLRKYAPQIAANVQANNALLRRLTEK